MTEPLPDLARRVDDGDAIALGGKTLHRAPMALVRELARLGVGDLTLVGLAGSMDVDLLCALGRVEAVHYGYVGFEWLGLAPNFRRAAERGSITPLEGTCYTVSAMLRGAKAGVSHLPVAGLDGSDLPAHNDHLGTTDDPFGGAESAAVRSLAPDVAAIHALEADVEGNVRLGGADLTEGLLARAADTVLVTAERVLEPGSIDAERVDVPGFLVDAVAEVPHGAHPLSCPGAYGYDVERLRAYLDASTGDADGFRGTHVAGTEADYRERAVAGREPAIDWSAPADERDLERDPAPGTEVTVAEVMCVAIARRLRAEGVDTAFQGFASPLPTAAVRLARDRFGAPTHLSASGAVNGRPAALPRSTEDARLLEGASARFTSPEAFDLAARGGIDVMFAGGAQIDRRGRTNSSVIGTPDDPAVRLPGGGGAGSLLSLVGEAWAWRTEHSSRTLPEAVDFVTASGNLAYLVTPLCAFERRDGDLAVTALHPGATREEVRERTGWDVSFDDPDRTDPPTRDELERLEAVDPNRVRRAAFAADDLRPIRGEHA